MSLNIDLLRQQFPALQLEDAGMPRIYLDNPGGTQVPEQVLRRIRDYLITSNANHGGYFRTSRESDALLEEAHQAMADFLNASSPREIIFGPNMTTLTFAISRSLAHWFKVGDEIILTRMDHDGNVAPWVQMAQERGLQVKWLNFSTDSYQYDYEQLESLLSPRVKLIAINYASNAIGTINDIKKVSQLVHKNKTLVYVDAVQYVPHAPTDVQDLGCDFLVCSAYKFFGPHQGILWGRLDLLEELPAYKVRPADDLPPGKFETGTQCHEGQAGTLGALEYLSWLGQTMAREYHDHFPNLSGRRLYLHAAMQAIKEYEKDLSAHLIRGLSAIKNIKIFGITQESEIKQRVPTISFIKEGLQPAQLSERLAEENIFVWDGHYYALEVIRHLGLEEKGGMLRVGAVHYNTRKEINILLNVLELFKSS
jgi:cysteine desulfurase family protein (TIGR01976 family)